MLNGDERFVLGTVTNDEKKEIEKIYKRKLALESLARLWKGEQDDNQLNDSMLNRLLDEMGEVSFAMRKWWGDISKKYAWEYGSNCIWEIDFNTNEIIIRKKDSSNNDGL